MHSVSRQSSVSIGSAKRLALVVLGLSLFFGVASVIKPPPQVASATPAPLTGSHSAKSSTSVMLSWSEASHPPHPKGWRLIGQLEGREYKVLCFGTPAGPRYSIFRLDGRPLQADLPADDVYRGFPGLDIENLQLMPGDQGPLMLMDQDRP